MDPQLTGWPLSAGELTFVTKAVHTRRPGCETGAQKLEFLPYTPSADGHGNPNWYVRIQEQFISVIDQYKRDHGPELDILLVGDSITWQWLGMGAPYSQYPQQFNAAWKSQFGHWKALNLGVAGDKTQGLLWRLDHGGTQGSGGPALKPRLVIVAIGHNDLYFTPDTGIKNAALGVLWCVKNVREKFPAAHVIVSKIFPSMKPAAPFYRDARAINAELELLVAAERDPRIHLLPDMWDEMVHPDGTLVEEYFRSEEASGSKVHLSATGGYPLWAGKLKPLVNQILGAPPLPKADTP